MEKLRLNSRGFHWWLIPLIIVVLGVIGFAAWYVWHSNRDTDTTQSSVTATPTPTPTPTPVAISATGNWSGQLSVTAPADCAGLGDTWEATLVDTDGVITGDYLTGQGYAGAATGAMSADQLTFTVTNPANAAYSFDVTISGDTLSGTFVGSSCSGDRTDDLSTGTITGIRN
jgi:hypothetical protein